MAKNATPWLKMIRAVYDGFDTGRHQGDVVARRVMDRAVSWLTAGLELSPRLQAKVIDNINMRTHYKVEDPGYLISLTRNQIQYAEKTNPEWFGLGLAGEDEPAENERNSAPFSATVAPASEIIPQVFSDLSAGIQQVFSTFSALFPQDALALAQHLVSIASITAAPGTTYCPPLTPKEIEWKEKKTNPDMIPMTRPQDDMRLASSPDMTAAGAANSIPESHEQGAYRDVGGSRCQDDNTHRNHGVETPAPAAEVAVSFFHNDPSRPPSANLELGGETFALVFSDADRAEEQMVGVCEKEWLDDFDAIGGADIRRESRAAGTGKTRYRLSPLYDKDDKRAKAAPVEANAVAVLFWNDDEQPTKVTIIRGVAMVEVPLSKFYGRKAMSPTHKGVLKVAA